MKRIVMIAVLAVLLHRTGSTVFEYWADNNFWFDGPVWTYYIRGTTINPSLIGPYEGSAS